MAQKKKQTGRTRRRFGNVRKLSSGRFQARYSHAPEPSGLTVSYKAPHTFEDEDAAIVWLKGQERLIDRGDWSPPEEQERRSQADAVTVMQYIDLYHDRKLASGEVRASTMQNYKNTVNNRIRDYPIADIRLPQLTAAHSYEWWDSVVADHPDTQETNRKAYVRLKAAVADAVERGYIEVNPVNVRAAGKKPTPKDKKLPTKEELAAIVEEVPNTHKVAAILCAFHGLRVGEALGLRVKDVTLADDAATVHVRSNLQRVKNPAGHFEMVRQEAKTEAGERDVPVLAPYVETIRRAVHQAEDASAEFSTGESIKSAKARRDNWLITTTRTGEAVFDTSFRSVWNRARERAGVRPDLTPHAGRNFLITALAEEGATPAEIGSLLGQRDISTIVGVYMKVRQERPASLMEKIAAMVRPE